ncbi:hypothetical protein [Dyadobacter sp. CY343]|uniref:hypothetical protein n=1 Tax=Dyadobacter sp. CY343 TaxID=2907299 RepID=UPI001F359D77|nr:hypothetical protein [Dyadobacter sp. CY343]MCE7059097.1 hypothetical protein [Dyadobacter sp. CY343]
MEIRNATEYQRAFQKIDGLVAAKFENSENQQREFLELAKAIQEYEKIHYPIHSFDQERVVHK